VDPENRINLGERIGIKMDKDRILRFKEVPEDIMQSIYSRLDKSFYDP
jgi:3-methyladenine DNA glycosylase Mpg